jgi:predicted negative regulator of RcsB-dependent stress response
MHFNLEEQEQLAEFKAWWKQYGKWLIAAAAVALLGYGSYTGWGWWTNRQSENASKLYDTMLIAAQKQDVAAVLRAAGDIQDQFSSTSYAGMASLVAAQISNAAGDMANTEKHLRWATDHAKSEAHADLAKVRLISLLIDKGDFAAADQLASGSASKAFMPLLLERRGDVQLAQQKNAEARKNYQEAWALLAKNPNAPDEAKRLLKVKLDAVGGL